MYTLMIRLISLIRRMSILASAPPCYKIVSISSQPDLHGLGSGRPAAHLTIDNSISTTKQHLHDACVFSMSACCLTCSSHLAEAAMLLFSSNAVLKKYVMQNYHDQTMTEKSADFLQNLPSQVCIHTLAH